MTLLWLSLIIRIILYYHPPARKLPDHLFSTLETVVDAVETSPASTTIPPDTAAVHTAEKQADNPQPSPVPDRPQRTASSDMRRQQIELNAADAGQLTVLRGIGPVLSRRIVAYRELLGGYVSVQQLKEVYGLRPGLVDTLTPSLRVDPRHIRQLTLPGATYRDLLRHPYLEKEHVENILTYIAVNHGIRETQELLQHLILDSTTYHRIRPYLHCTGNAAGNGKDSGTDSIADTAGRQRQ
ncbi:MAG: helix-hairpin-helix domain-containing protein [Bacteroidales bacterium]|nr:helix-hairpin-helix domain-containing protein [Bacteroidales bacterium]MBQ7213756.1 helix-hairpin-helix domain-containing protein [Bacteroidales bacterium]